jgi:hypothetical protein
MSGRMSDSPFSELTTVSSARNSRVALAITAAWIAGCFVIAWDSLPLPNIGFAQDLGIMLDAGWRFYQGQRVHADFHSPLGPVLGLIFGIPMIFLGPTYESLTLVPPFISAAVALWVWFLCRNDLSTIQCATVSTALGAVAGGIHHPGFAPEILTFATFYNRVGFALLSISFLAVFLPRHPQFPNHSHLLNGSALLASVLIFFLKANFVVPAALCVCLGAACHSRSHREARFAIGIGLLAMAMGLFLIGFRVDLMIRDFLMAGDARRAMIGNYFYPLRNTLANLDSILLMLVFSVTCLPTGKLRKQQLKPFVCHLFLIWVPFILGLLVSVTQSHGDGRGIATVLCGLAASLAWQRRDLTEILLPFGGGPLELGRLDQGADSPETLAVELIRRRVCGGVLVAASLLFIVPHAQSYLQWYRVSQAIKGQQFEARPIQKLFVGPVVNNWGENFPSLINEACDLLQSRCEPQQGLQYIDVSNPLSFACGLRSPKQSMLWWDVSTYTPRNCPEPKSLDDTQAILLPKVPMLPAAVTQWLEIYGGELQRSFALDEETRNFKLYKRRP